MLGERMPQTYANHARFVPLFHFVVFGLLILNALYRLYAVVRWFGLDYKRAVAYTLVLVGLVWNGSGAITFAWMAEVKWSWLPALLAGSLLGGYAGAHLAIVRGNKLIKRSYEIISMLIGLKLLLP